MLLTFRVIAIINPAFIDVILAKPVLSWPLALTSTYTDALMTKAVTTFRQLLRFCDKFIFPNFTCISRDT